MSLQNHGDADLSGNRYGSRALSAYFRRFGNAAAFPTTPELLNIDGKEYVILRNVNGILAVYRVDVSTGALRMLKKYPQELKEHYGEGEKGST